MMPKATKIGRAFDTQREARPIAPPVDAESDTPTTNLENIQPAPVKKEDFGPEWQDTPSIDGQATKHPTTVRGTGVITEVFDLSDAAQLARYNALNAQATTKNPTIIVVKDQSQFAEKTGGWMVFFQYRKIQFRKLVPEKVENN
jgi:hypothetical protein